MPCFLPFFSRSFSVLQSCLNAMASEGLRESDKVLFDTTYIFIIICTKCYNNNLVWLLPMRTVCECDE